MPLISIQKFIAKADRPAADKTWTDFCPPRRMSAEHWDRLIAMIGPKEIRMVRPDSGEDSQGLWVQHHISISKRGMYNLHRCAQVLTDFDVPTTL